MSRFNATKKPIPKVIPTTNLAGGTAFNPESKLKLALISLTTFLEDEFYRKGSATIDEIVQLAKEVPAEFLARLALYTRHTHGLRSISHLLASLAVSKARGTKWITGFLKKVVRRVDDMLEIVSCYYYLFLANPENKLKIPNSMKRAFRSILGSNRFTEYQLAKYRKENSELSLVDLVNLIHPVPFIPQDKKWDRTFTPALSKLINGTLRNTETMETSLSSTQAGSEERGILLQENLESGKFGYMAVLKNLTNILDTGNEKAINETVAKIMDPESIISSKVLPFRFDIAYNMLERYPGAHAERVRVALEHAIDISLGNVPLFEGSTLVVIDTSGSMTSTVSNTAKTPIRIASLFGAAIYKRNLHADMMLFDSTEKWYTPSKTSSILSISRQICRDANGGATYLHNVFNRIIRERRKYDRIIVLSDMQCYGANQQQSFDKYRDLYNDVKLYSFDVTAYGKLAFYGRNIYLFSGISEKIFDIFEIIEKDKNALIHEIEKIDL